MARRSPPPLSPERLQELERAFEAGRHEEVLELTANEKAAPQAVLLRAASLEALGHAEEALETLRLALKSHPDELELLWTAAELAMARAGDDPQLMDEALRWCARGRKKAPNDEEKAEFLVLEAAAYNQIGECALALTRAEEANSLSTGNVEAERERALALFELCRFDAAMRALESLHERLPDEAWIHQHLALIHERREAPKEARRHFARAHELDAESFPQPVQLSDEQFDAAVQAAVARLPAEVKAHLENTTLAVQALPSDEDLLAENPPLSPTILGVFHGTPVGQRSITSSVDHFPARIVLYQRNLERYARTREELVDQIGITVMHEVGHLIGLEEEDLWERGLD